MYFGLWCLLSPISLPPSSFSGLLHIGDLFPVYLPVLENALRKPGIESFRSGQSLAAPCMLHASWGLLLILASLESIFMENVLIAEDSLLTTAPLCPHTPVYSTFSRLPDTGCIQVTGN